MRLVGGLVLVSVLAGCSERREPIAAPAPAPGEAARATTNLPTESKQKVASHEEATVLRPHREEPVVECPVAAMPDDDDELLSVLLDAANKEIVKGAYASAWTCADRASDLAPTSVEAHHLRGAALAGLGRDPDAQVAYQLALALDPDDPETLRAVADFYINGKGDRGRDSLRLGLELAQRGTRRVTQRRRRDLKASPLAADLAILEAQALNDLGRSDEALTRIDAALTLAPNRGDALHERGVALFDLSRFTDAKSTFVRALALQPEDPYTHQLYGLTLEQLGDEVSAQQELATAIELAPDELYAPVLIPVDEFRAEIESIIAALPADRAARVRAVAIEVADLPDPADLSAVTPPFPPTILGLYRGPVGAGIHGHVPTGGHGDEAPSIVLYRKNLGRAVRTRAELSEQIRDTLLHEIGHLEGLDEDDLRRRGMD